MKSDVKKPADPAFLNQRLIPADQFKEKMRAVMAVPKSELDARIAADKTTSRIPKAKNATGE